jgi:hypothetical protein
VGGEGELSDTVDPLERYGDDPLERDVPARETRRAPSFGLGGGGGGSGGGGGGSGGGGESVVNEAYTRSEWPLRPTPQTGALINTFDQQCLRNIKQSQVLFPSSSATHPLRPGPKLKCKTILIFEPRDWNRKAETLNLKL